MKKQSRGRKRKRKQKSSFIRTGRKRQAGPTAELKFFDTVQSFTVNNRGEVPSTGQLTLIPQGITESTRIGRKCVIRKIQVKLSLTYDPDVVTSGVAQTFIYLILDHQCNGAAADVTDVFDTGSFENTFENVANSKRFDILKTWVHNFTTGAGVSMAFAKVIKQVTFDLRCKIPIEYSGTSGVLTEITSNNIFLMAGEFLASDDVSVFGIVRLRYTDG